MQEWDLYQSNQVYKGHSQEVWHGWSKIKQNSNEHHITTKLNKNENGKPVNEKRFRGMIGSLLYLTISRQDIIFVIWLCAKFQSSPREFHLNAIKRIFKYLSGSLHLGLWYPKNSSFDLISYSDVEFAGSLLARKSTFGTCQFLGQYLVPWLSK